MHCRPRPLARPSLTLVAAALLGGALTTCADEKPVPPPECGNAVIEAGEECEGDPLPRVGCKSDTCTIDTPDYRCFPPEDAEPFTGDPPIGLQGNWTCEKIPDIEFCGDGVIELARGESCDDGNTDIEDGCSACRIDADWACSGEPSICFNCGDGFVQGPEECDEGFNLQDHPNNPGCSEQCRVVPGWTCVGTVLSVCSPTCGDGIWLDTTQGLTQGFAEGCDDGNRTDGDGCSSACRVERGWDCSLEAAPLTSVCEPIPPEGSSSESDTTASESDTTDEEDTGTTTGEDTGTTGDDEATAGGEDTTTTGGNPTTSDTGG